LIEGGVLSSFRGIRSTVVLYARQVKRRWTDIGTVCAG
jgi:hypothetical protein